MRLWCCVVRQRSRNVVESPDPQDVASFGGSSSVAPCDVAEVERFPEQIGWQVLGTPEPHASACGSFRAALEVIDKRSSV